MKKLYRAAICFAILFLVMTLALAGTADVVYAGITPTATSPPTNTPVPTETAAPTNTPVATGTAEPTETPAPTSTPPPADDGGGTTSTTAQVETPVPTPDAIPALGAGPGPHDVLLMGGVLLLLLSALAVAWWKVWQIGRHEA